MGCPVPLIAAPVAEKSDQGRDGFLGSGPDSTQRLGGLSLFKAISCLQDGNQDRDGRRGRRAEIREEKQDSAPHLTLWVLQQGHEFGDGSGTESGQYPSGNRIVTASAHPVLQGEDQSGN